MLLLLSNLLFYHPVSMLLHQFLFSLPNRDLLLNNKLFITAQDMLLLPHLPIIITFGINAVLFDFRTLNACLDQLLFNLILLTFSNLVFLRILMIFIHAVQFLFFGHGLFLFQGRL